MDPTLLDGLSKRVEKMHRELGELIQEQNSPVGQRELSRNGYPGSSAENRRRRGTVVGTAKRWSRPDGGRPAAGSMSLGDRKGLGGGQVGEDPGECSSEHRLAGTRWANEHQMVPPCCGDLEGASCPKLTPDGAQIDGSSTIRGWRRLCRQTVILSESHRHRVRQAAHTAHITTRQGRLGDPRRRHEARRRATRRHDPGSEAAPRRTYGAVERQLADGDDVGRRGMYLT